MFFREGKCCFSGRTLLKSSLGMEYTLLEIFDRFCGSALNISLFFYLYIENINQRVLKSTQ